MPKCARHAVSPGVPPATSASIALSRSRYNGRPTPSGGVREEVDHCPRLGVELGPVPARSVIVRDHAGWRIASIAPKSISRPSRTDRWATSNGTGGTSPIVSPSSVGTACSNSCASPSFSHNGSPIPPPSVS